MKDAINVARKAGLIFFYIMMILVGGLLSVFGFWAMFTPQPDKLTAQAQITYADPGYYNMTTEMQEDYLYKVTYTDCNGVEHKDVKLTSYDSRYTLGYSLVIEYDPNNPDEMVNEEGSEIVLYVVTAVGTIVAIAGIICLIKSFGKKVSDMNELNKVDMQQVSAEQIEKVKQSTDPINSYYFHWCGKLNQSYVLETPERTAVYVANCDKVRFFRPTDYEFANLVTQESQSHKIGHTLTTNIGTGSQHTTYSIPTSSSFKIDGINCWEYFGKLGYSLERQFTGLGFNFDVLHYGVKVARLTAAGTNILPQREGKACAIGRLPTTGLYEVQCANEDLEAVFWACFITSRVEFI